MYVLVASVFVPGTLTVSCVVMSRSLKNWFVWRITGKEYSKADSRYATRDAFVIQMEGVTAFAWGPLSFLAAYGLATSKHWRFTLMSIISLGQFYGCVLYFTTCQHIGQYSMLMDMRLAIF